jgi:hypothetical protein
MEVRLITCSIVITCLSVVFASCSLFVKANTVEYEYDNGFKHRKLVMDVPFGFIEECHTRDDKGFLVRSFRYKDGAEIFIACRDMANNPVISLDLSAENLAQLPRIWGQPGSGTHGNGTRWSRSQREGFMVGYDFVDPNQRELFDRSVQSLHIVH